MPNLDVYRAAIVAYRKWLESQSTSACKRFLTRIASQDERLSEGALGEALAWNWLEPRTDKVQLNEDESTGGPDFVCACEDRSYLVEVSTLTTDAVANATALPEFPTLGPRWYRSLTRAILRKVIHKSPQASDLDLPYVLFIPTVHFQASTILVSTAHLEHILVGSTGIGGAFDPVDGVIGNLQNVATLDHPCFFETRTLHPTRRHMSAVLVGGFGFVPPDCTIGGVLHPDPIRPFAPICLPDTCLGRLEPWPPANGLRVVWELADGTRCDDEAEREKRTQRSEMNLRRAGFGPFLHELADERRRRTP